MRSSWNPSRTETRDAHLEQVLRALVHAEGHLGADLTLGTLARVGHVSEFHFQRVFRRVVGASPSAWVRKLRLDWAANQLLVGSRRIAAIAEACGYRELASFYRAFRARFGLTPAAFRDRGARRRPAEGPAPGCLRVWVNEPLDDGQLRYVPVAATSRRGRGRPQWRVVDLPVLRIAFVRGPASIRTEPDEFRVLADFATRRQPAEDLVFLRVIHDDDRVTRAREIRVDRGVVFGPRRRGQAAIGARAIGGVRYVAATAEGGGDAPRRVHAWIESSVLPRLGGSRADGPIIEVLLDDPRTPPADPRERLIDVLVPVDGVKPSGNWYWRRRRPPPAQKKRRTKP